MKKNKIIYLITAYSIFILFSICCFPQDKSISEPGSKKSEIDTLFKILDQSLKTKDLNKFCSVFSTDKDLLNVGIDINALAFDYETLKAIQNEQFKIVDDFDVQLKDRKIILSDDGKEARYYQNYDLSFRVYTNNFHVNNVRETGVLEFKNGGWVIVQEHVSVPVTNELWPAYLAKKSFIPDPKYEFTVPELLEDFDLFTLALEEAHSGLYRFNNPQDYKILTDEIKSKLDHPMAAVDFYRLLCPIIAAIKCGHTRISLSNQIEEYLDNKNIFIPFQFRFLLGRAYVVKNVTKNTIPPGSEILSINDKPMSGIISDIFEKQGSDGDILTAKYKRLDNSFPKLYCQLIEQTNQFRIKFIPNGRMNVKEITINGVDDSVWRQGIYTNIPQAKELLKLQIMKDSGVAVLDIREFVSRDINEMYGSFKHFTDSAFSLINENNIQNLIIDLRGNGGGNIAQELVPYLFDKPVKYYKIIDAAKTRFSFLEFTDKGNFFNDVHVNLWKKYRNEAGRYELAGDYNEDIIPSPLVYNGRLFVLIDGESFSGTSELCSILHDQHRALFFGEETGGCCSGSCSGDYLNLTLPNSQIKVVIPIRNYVMNISTGNNFRRGVIPDYELTSTIQEVLTGKDSQMNYVFDYISKHK